MVACLRYLLLRCQLQPAQRFGWGRPGAPRSPVLFSPIRNETQCAGVFRWTWSAGTAWYIYYMGTDATCRANVFCLVGPSRRPRHRIRFSLRSRRLQSLEEHAGRIEGSGISGPGPSQSGRADGMGGVTGDICAAAGFVRRRLEKSRGGTTTRWWFPGRSAA